MLFRPLHTQALMQGRLVTEGGATVIADYAGGVYPPDQVAFALPDDEPQASAIRAAGYRTHTPLSVELGPNATG